MPSSSDLRARHAITGLGRGQTSARHCNLHEAIRSFRETHSLAGRSGKNAFERESSVVMDAPEDGRFDEMALRFGTRVA